MKRTLVRITIGVVVLLAVAVIAVSLSLGFMLHKGVETVGPQITKTDVQLEDAQLSLFSGSGELEGFVLGNPEGYQSESAISIGRVELAVAPASLLSDKVHVTKVHILEPVITLEGGLTRNNLKEILDNVEAAAGAPGPTTPTEEETAPAKKLQIDDLRVRGAKVSVRTPLTQGRTVSLTLPDIQLQNLGQGPEGVTPADVARRVLEELLAETITAVQQSVPGLSTGAVEAVKERLGTNTSQQIETITEGLKGILK